MLTGNVSDCSWDEISEREVGDVSFVTESFTCKELNEQSKIEERSLNRDRQKRPNHYDNFHSSIRGYHTKKDCLLTSYNMSERSLIIMVILYHHPITI